MGGLDWLIPGNDHRLAREKYPDRESASATARRKDFKPAKSAAEAARVGQKWEDDTR
jgi:hypothetical protein